MSMSATKDDLSTNLSDLSIGQTPKSTSKPRKQAPVADSWEDDADEISTDSDRELDEASASTSVSARAGGTSPLSQTRLSSKSPPPPSNRPQPSQVAFAPDGTPLSPASSSGIAAPPNTPHVGGIDGLGRRPEKTTGPAARMIAGALGVRAPKKTEEQRQYDKAVREKEMKKREEEREQKKREEAERERLRREAWDG